LAHGNAYLATCLLQIPVNQTNNHPQPTSPCAPAPGGSATHLYLA
jgi:hypothetical protein